MPTLKQKYFDKSMIGNDISSLLYDIAKERKLSIFEEMIFDEMVNFYPDSETIEYYKSELKIFNFSVSSEPLEILIVVSKSDPMLTARDMGINTVKQRITLIKLVR
ncbi:hypothetical protein P4S55_07505 [Shewanella sp. PP-Sp27a-2]